MPNGTEFTPRQFRQAEAPLKDSDAILTRFAQLIGAKIICNYHSMPSRIITLETTDGIVRSIRIFPTEFKRGLPWGRGDYRYELSLSASKNVGGNAHGWYRMYRRLKEMPGKEGNLLQVLQSGWEKLQSLAARDLKPVHY